MPHLLIIGASGVLGIAASRFFLEKGYRVTAFVRDSKKIQGLEAKGASIIVGDLTNPQTLNGIFKEVDIVLTSAHGMMGKGKNKSLSVDEAGHKRLIDEAKKAGVKHFIYTSVNTASPEHPIDFFRTKYVMEQYLIKSGLCYTILKMPAFMEWHVYNLLGKNILEKGKTTILGSGNNPTNFIAVKDVVSAIDKIALNENYFNKIVSVGGPQNISRNEIAELFGKALKIKPQVGHVPIGVLKLLSGLFQPFHPGIARIMKLSITTDTSNETMEDKYTIAQFGLKPTTIEEFIQAVIEKKGNDR